MDTKQRGILTRVLRRPPPTDIPWEDLESMLRAAGVDVRERPSSRVALIKDGEIMIVRRPHQQPLAVQATVRDIAAFLRAAGVNR